MNSERNLQIVEMFQRGLTLRAIAMACELSHQRVAQVITRYGPDGIVGGASLRRRQRLQRLAAARDARYVARFGHTYREHRGILAAYAGGPMKRRPLGAFNQQRRNAKRREIPWLLTFAQWWALWSESGKWAERGLRKGCYVMSRRGDAGTYEVGNVFIQQTSENIREWFARPQG